MVFEDVLTPKKALLVRSYWVKELWSYGVKEGYSVNI